MFVKMSPGNLLEIVPADLLDTLFSSQLSLTDHAMLVLSMSLCGFIVSCDVGRERSSKCLTTTAGHRCT